MTAQSRQYVKRSFVNVGRSLLALCTGFGAEYHQPAQLPKTAPASQAILNSYEGQNVTAVEIAGRPNLDTSKLLPLLQQHAGSHSREKKSTKASPP